ncbi:MAG: Panacea domain-containing protein [Rudaea sp.]
MLKTHEREKLINVIVFFAKNTRYCGKTKLFKLLYLLDFELFRQTGHTVTGSAYRAWEKGPVPYTLWREWPALQMGQANADITAAVEIVPEMIGDYELQRLVPLVDFDNSHFTKREMRIMEELATRFREERTKPLINFTHQSLGPWEKTWQDGRGNDQEIPYELAVDDDDPNREAVLEAASEYEGMKAAFGVVH